MKEKIVCTTTFIILLLVSLALYDLDFPVFWCVVSQAVFSINILTGSQTDRLGFHYVNFVFAAISSITFHVLALHYLFGGTAIIAYNNRICMKFPGHLWICDDMFNRTIIPCYFFCNGMLNAIHVRIVAGTIVKTRNQEKIITIAEV